MQGVKLFCHLSIVSYATIGTGEYKADKGRSDEEYL
jgi:hypothetical protein